MSMNLNVKAMKDREIISDVCIGMKLTLSRIGIYHMRVERLKRLRSYWRRELNATREDLYKTDGARRAPKQTR